MTNSKLKASNLLDKSIEIAWLIAVVIIPIACVEHDYFFTESVISNAELPKIAILRIISATMLILYIVKITSNNQFRSSFTDVFKLLEGIQSKPANWIIMAVIIFSVSSVITTLVSYDFKISMWGLVPGQDGYSTYNMLCYIVIFAIVVKHLKTIHQLRRLGVAIILMGVIVSSIGICQHFGFNVFGLMSDEYKYRVQMTAGNALFAGSLIIMPISITLIVSTMHLNELAYRSLQISSQIKWHVLWCLILAIQLSALLFTLSRGPWVSAAIIIFIFIVGLSINSQKNLVFTVLYILVIAVTIAMCLTLIPVKGFYSSTTESNDLKSNTSAKTYSKLFIDRISSIQSESTSGNLNQRIPIWQSSWHLIYERPWFGQHTDKLQWLRVITGYGPESFKYVFQLESPLDASNHLPIEAHHAHNYLIHQTVVQGVLGFISTILLFLCPLAAVIYCLSKKMLIETKAYKILMLGILAFLIGRICDQMLGIARVSDMLLYWVLLAGFISILNILKTNQPAASKNISQQFVTNRRTSKQPARFWKYGFIFIVISAIMVFTFQNATGYPRAARIMADAKFEYSEGNLESALYYTEQAISIAEEISTYYLFKNLVLHSFLKNTDMGHHPGCVESINSRIYSDTYKSCVYSYIHKNAISAAKSRPLEWLTAFNLADSFVNLQDYDNAHNNYESTLALLPNSWVLHNKLADVYITSGKFRQAKEHLILSLSITEQYGLPNPAKKLLRTLP